MLPNTKLFLTNQKTYMYHCPNPIHNAGVVLPLYVPILSMQASEVHSDRSVVEHYQGEESYWGIECLVWADVLRDAVFAGSMKACTYALRDAVFDVHVCIERCSVPYSRKHGFNVLAYAWKAECALSLSHSLSLSQPFSLTQCYYVCVHDCVSQSCLARATF
jgi:hypothetical protein